MFDKTILDNGLSVITANMPATRSVCIAIFIGVGSRYESDEEAGASHFIEHMCFKGTRRRPTTQEIAEAIEGVGGMLNGGTGKEFTVYWCKVARPHFALSMDVLVDMMRYPKFEIEDLERERLIIMEELKESIDSPQERVGLMVNEMLWPGQPLGRDIIGLRESIGTIGRDTILKVMRNFYGPNNTVVAIAGDLEHNGILTQVEEAFRDWPAVEPGCFVPAEDGQDAPRVRVERRDTEQVHICLGLKGLSIAHPDRYIFDLINVVLSGGMSSRLNLELRERLGLVYDIDSYVDYYRDSGSLTVYAGADPGNTEATVKAVIEELAKMRNEVPAAEFAKVKELVKGRLLLGMEDTRSVASWGGRQQIMTGEVRTVDEVVSIIDAIKPADLQRVATQLLRAESLSLAVVGPVASEEGLHKLLRF